MNSRAKGKRGELEAKDLLSKIFAIPHRRGVQYEGSSKSADVVCCDAKHPLAHLHWECKWVERGVNLDTFMEQAVHDSGEGDVPCVLHKRSRKEPLVTIRASDMLRFAHFVLAEGSSC